MNLDLNTNIPAVVTESIKGTGYLDLKITTGNKRRLRITMPVEAMAGLGTMMAEVANRTMGKTIDFPIEIVDLNPIRRN